MNVRQGFANKVYCLIQCFYWMSGCAVIGFAAVFLAERGFSSFETGVICAVAAVLSFAVMTHTSSLIDFRRYSVFHLLCCLYAAVFICLIILIADERADFPAAAAYTVCIAAAQTLGSTYNKLYADLVHIGIAVNFGLARGMGSLSFAVASAVFGVLVRNCGVAPLLVLTAVLLLPQFAGALYFRKLNASVAPYAGSTNAGGAKGLTLRAFISNYRRFFWLVIGIGIVLSVNMSFTAFLINIVEKCGGTPETLGYLNASMAMMEIPVIMCYSKIRKRFTAKQLMMTGIIFFTVKTACLTFSVSVPMLLAATTMHAFSFGLFTPASVDYVSEKITYEDSAKGQSLMAAMPVLGSSFTIFVSGALLDLLSTFTVLLILLAFSVLGTLVCIAAGTERRSDKRKK